MEPSKAVIVLLDRLQGYMVEEGFVVCEEEPESGAMRPSDVALAELYQDMVDAANLAREERTNEAPE